MNTFTLIGLLTSLLGSATIYLASPSQRWLAVPWPARAARPAGFLLLLAGLLALLQALQPAAGSFVFVHWLMLLFVLLPYLGALLDSRRKTRS